MVVLVEKSIALVCLALVYLVVAIYFSDLLPDVLQGAVVWLGPCFARPPDPKARPVQRKRGGSAGGTLQP